LAAITYGAGGNSASRSTSSEKTVLAIPRIMGGETRQRMRDRAGMVSKAELTESDTPPTLVAERTFDLSVPRAGAADVASSFEHRLIRESSAAAQF
jgi:hypothetical protein